MRKLFVVFLLCAGSSFAAEPLPSWNDANSRNAIVAFVEKVTKDNSPDFVPVSERIAVFDNDGTLWCEQPMYVQWAFALDRIRTLSAKHPEWKDRQPFRAALAGDPQELAAIGENGLLELIVTAHSGMTTEAFEEIVTQWLAEKQHPRFDRPYTECVYQPMLEVLAYLRDHQFKTFIVSGGGIEFMRPWTDRVYGIPTEQVVGSMGKLKYELIDGKPAISMLPGVNFIDDKAGKPLGIQRFIGRRPVMAFGNSDGDFEMLEWTTAGTGPRFGLLVHHTDADREYAYDRKSEIGRLERGLDEGPKRGWTIVDMKHDWKQIFPVEK